MVEADDDELVCELTFVLPDAGLGPTDGNPTMILGEDRNDNTPVMIAEDTEDSPSDGRRYLTQARRSEVATNHTMRTLHAQPFYSSEQRGRTGVFWR